MQISHPITLRHPVNEWGAPRETMRGGAIKITHTPLHTVCITLSVAVVKFVAVSSRRNDFSTGPQARENNQNDDFSPPLH